MGTLDADIEAGMLEVLTGLGRTITIRRKVKGAFNSSTMVRASTDTTSTVTAMREPSRYQQAGSSSQQEFEYTFRKTDLAFDPDVNDQIDDTLGTDTLILSVVAVETAAGGLAWKLRARAMTANP